MSFLNDRKNNAEFTKIFFYFVAKYGSVTLAAKEIICDAKVRSVNKFII